MGKQSFRLELIRQQDVCDSKCNYYASPMMRTYHYGEKVWGYRQQRCSEHSKELLCTQCSLQLRSKYELFILTGIIRHIQPNTLPRWCHSPPIVSTTSAMFLSPSCPDCSHEDSSLPCLHWDEALRVSDGLRCNEMMMSELKEHGRIAIISKIYSHKNQGLKEFNWTSATLSSVSSLIQKWRSLLDESIDDKRCIKIENIPRHIHNNPINHGPCIKCSFFYSGNVHFNEKHKNSQFTEQNY